MDYNKKKSSSGTIFLDHGWDKSFISDNNIIWTPYEKWNDVCQAAKIQRRILSKETSCDHFIYSKEDKVFESDQFLCGESTGSDADHICK